jgi:hypothetical protein
MLFYWMSQRSTMTIIDAAQYITHLKREVWLKLKVEGRPGCAYEHCPESLHNIRCIAGNERLFDADHVHCKDDCCGECDANPEFKKNIELSEMALTAVRNVPF